ncbi:hypothetical protein CL614_05905 [archaeon]|nr:hypothetical protein [archaeon]
MGFDSLAQLITSKKVKRIKIYFMYMAVQELTAIVKPTHNCNLKCRYCYLPENAKHSRMDQTTLQNTTDQLVGLDGLEDLNIIWHGGEPLLMGVDFFRQAIGMQPQDGNVQISNNIQSNVTLVNDEILDFCQEADIDIGMSLDGPKEIHNMSRVYPSGKGSFDDAFRGVMMVKERDLGRGVISVVTKKTIGYARDIYDFAQEHGLSLKFNPLITSGRELSHHDDLALGPEEYGNAMCDLFDYWMEFGEGAMPIDPFDTIIANMTTDTVLGCNYKGGCRKAFISIGPSGEVYPCGRFDGIDEAFLGNINEDNLQDMLESTKHSKMAERSSETVPGCKICDYKKICNAGCMHNAYMVNGDFLGKDYYCASYKKMFNHITNRVKAELKKAEWGT